MKKSILIFVAVIVCLLLPINTSAEVTSISEVTFTVKADADAGLDGDVVITFTKSGSKYNGTLYLPGSADTDKLMLTWDDSVSVSGFTSGETAVPANGTNKTYSVTVGSSTAVFTVNTVQGSTDVKGMFLNIDESMGTIDEMNGDSDHNKECFGVVYFDGKDYDMSIKGRGNWTWGVTGTTSNPSKKPYNITIYKDENPNKGIERFSKKDKVSFIDGVKTKKWSLLANYADGSLLRNKIGYDLAYELGVGIESEFVDIWMNGKYIGNYLITPKSDYKAPDGGYFLELDNNLDAEDPYFALEGLLPAGSSDNVITVKDVGDDAVAAGVTTEDIQEYMQTMLNAVMREESDDYLQYVDLDSWAKLYLLHEFYKNHDIICGSILMHRDGLTGNDKLIAGPVWDLDNALGRVFVNNHCGIDSTIQRSANGWFIDSISIEDGYTSFLQYLGKHDSFMRRVYEIYNTYKYAFENVTANIDNQVEKISASVSMNYSVWNVNQWEYNATKVYFQSTLGTGNYAYTEKKTSTYQDYLDNLKAYVTKRLAYLSDNLTVTAPTDGSIIGDTNVASGKQIILTADTVADSYQWQSSTDGTEWTNINGATEKTYSDTAIITMNGLYVRCVARNDGETVSTSHVARVASGAVTVLDPVILNVSSVNILDAIALKKRIEQLSGSEPSSDDIAKYDVNKDGLINKSDLSSLIYFILNVP